MKRIDVLREAHKLLKKNKVPGICDAIKTVMRDNNLIKYESYQEVYKYFTLFTIENAIKFSNRLKNNRWYYSGSYWWKPGNFRLFSGRRRFMRWLMWKYRNDKEEII